MVTGQRFYGAAVEAQIGADRGIAARGADIDGHYPYLLVDVRPVLLPIPLVPGRLNAAPIPVMTCRLPPPVWDSLGEAGL